MTNNRKVLYPKDLRELGLEFCDPPRRCPEGHLCEYWPCQTCLHRRARENQLRLARLARDRKSNP